MARAAVAIFVRTPGLSQPKTRLAQEIGKDTAARIYELALACSRRLATELAAQNVEVVWAVAEPEGVGSEFWRSTGLDSILSGSGSLGDCLANVHGELRKRAEVTVLLDSDSPQLAVSDIECAWTDRNWRSYMAGPATDGGFYMFASRVTVAPEVWTSVRYSEATTLDQLTAALGGGVELLARHPDFDDLASLFEVLDDMPDDMSDVQRAFVDFAVENLSPQPYRTRAGSARNIS